MLAILYDWLFAGLRFGFLLNLAFIIGTTTVTFAARRLLVASFAFFAIFYRGLANFARLGVLLLLTTVTAVFFARLPAFAILGTIIAVVTIIAAIAIIPVVTTVIAIAAVVRTRFTTLLLTLGFLFRFFST